MGQSLIAICPKCKHKEVYEGQAKRPRIHCEECKHRYYITPQKTHKKKEEEKKKVKELIPPEMTTGDIVNAVDDPVGFVTSIITKELMKTRDVRWATLFVSILKESKKLDYSTQQEIEWSNQAKQLSIEDLVEKVAIKGSISKNISRRLEKADDTSPYDNFSDV